ncbi:MAG: hypothetical protein HFG66_08530 [Hungatella sp.]|nr:hypothetical protein [Hungatella sp.]
MQQLIKITTEPIRIETFSQNARLVSSNSVDLERRKAIARSTALQKTAGQGSASIEHIRRINRTFSQSNVNTVTPKTENFQEQLISRQSQQSAPAPAKMPQVMQVQAPVISSDNGSSVVSAVSNAPAVTASSRDVSAEPRSSYTAQRGAFEMRVARGDLTYLPPLVMTVITQRPQVHVEYIGGFNYVPPRETDSGGNINLFT